MWAWATSLLSGISLRTIGWIAAAATVVLLLFRAREAGKHSERVEQYEQVLKNVKDKNEARKIVDGMRDDAVLDELRNEWSRN